MRREPRRDLRSVLPALRRLDGSSLGGGTAAAFAPRVPLHDLSPGFWDPVHFADVPIRRLFTLLLADEADQPIPLRCRRRKWRPDRLWTAYDAEGLAVVEERALLPGDAFVSRLEIRNLRRSARRLAAILWAAQVKGPRAKEERAAFLGADFAPGVGRMRLELRPARPREVARRAVLRVEFAASPAFESRFACVARRGGDRPVFETSPLAGALGRGRLSGEVRLRDGEKDGEGKSGLPSAVHVGLARRLRLAPGGRAALVAGARLSLLRAPGLRRREKVEPLPHALARDPIGASERSWTGWLDGVPSFECDDPCLESAWWRRWSEIRLHAVDARAGNLPRPCVLEGPDLERALVPSCVQAHARECAWMRDPSLGEGSLLGILERMDPRGALPGSVGLLDAEPGADFPASLADLGGCALLLYSIHGRLGFVREVQPLLERHARHWRRDLDRESWNLFDVQRPRETGREGASRENRLRRKGVDAAVYGHGLHRALAFFATRLRDLEAARRHSTVAAAIAKAIRDRMWDPRAESFFDLDPRTGRRVRAEGAAGFYPFLWGIAGREHLGAMRRLFDARARGRRDHPDRAWAGRDWPMAGSHVADALDRAASLDPRLAPRAGAFLRRLVRRMAGPMPPVSPSWANDAIVRIVAGLRPHPSGGLRLHPRPAGLGRFLLRGAPWQGRRIDVEWDGRTLLARIDGRVAARRSGLGPLDVAPAPGPTGRFRPRGPGR